MKPTMYLCLCAFLFLSSRCQSPLDDLPTETQEGKGIFACLVNGNIWKPAGRTGLTSNLQPEYGINGYLGFYCYRIIDGKKSWVRVSSENIYKEGTYKIQGLQEINLTNGNTGYSDENNCEYGIYQKNIIEGEMEITKFEWLPNGHLIIAGRFFMTLSSPENQQCKEIIKITHGRFDVKFQ
jgi:hypothetical protein